MAVYAVSDLHIHGEEQPYLFTPEKEALFVRLVSEILESESELVIAGDCIDFTGMQRPRRGHLEFFEELFGSKSCKNPIIRESLRRRTPREELQRVLKRYPRMFKALGELAHRRRLTLIPGNHDCLFGNPFFRRTFAQMLNVPDDAICWARSMRINRVAFAAHGNNYDPSNQTKAGCHNPGMAITAALYNGLMPALSVFGVPQSIVQAVPAVRPEEAVIRGIAEYLGMREADALVEAFVRLIARNGYFQGWKNALLFPFVHRIPPLSFLMNFYLTPDALIRAMPDESKMRHHVREKAEELCQKLQPDISVVVLGHTHELDHSDTYMNLGTWIDHITGISLDHLRRIDNSLPVLRVERSGDVALYDARDLTHAQELKFCRRIYGSNYGLLGSSYDEARSMVFK